MAQQQGGGGGGGGDNSMAIVWIMVLAGVTIYLIWAFGSKQIVSAVFQANLLQGKVIAYFIDRQDLNEAISYMQTVDPSNVTWEMLMAATRVVGSYASYPIMVILVLLAIYLYQSNTALKYRKTHNMKTLAAQEQYNWPAIMPIVKLDLVNEDVNIGPWAMALTPMEFAQKHNLLKKEDAMLEVIEPGMEMTAGIRRGDAKRIFTLQLGPYWEGFDKCSPQAYALCAVFMARINRDRTSANLILETIDRTYVAGKPDFTVAKPILKKYENTELVQEIVVKHAYMLTVISSLLEVARQDGVVPTAEFLWLKTIDRRLWYMLNSIGRQTPFAEVGGPFAHWKAEKAMKRRSLVPMIDEAIKALDVAIKEVKMTPKAFQELKP